MWHVLIILAALLAVSACKPHDEILSTWRGAPEDKLVSIWGTPNETFTTEEGVQVLVYSKNSRNDLIVPSGGRNQTSSTCETTFTLEKGRVVGYAHSGSGC